ncbi:hypothetical protein BpHYR1_003194 [Brachionus plicatilis]|uniref:Uncharacterized protein n=1 Tax=Brachionus plicatilis TaxID=10195 RepID=A0A3M7R009_BRAPC|nr:hypothetical protein BpHYR1_003194 [Brachionus plicatilis]
MNCALGGALSIKGSRYSQTLFNQLEDKVNEVDFVYWESVGNSGVSKSWIIWGRKRLSKYEARENLKPGIICSVTAAPPTT